MFSTTGKLSIIQIVRKPVVWNNFVCKFCNFLRISKLNFFSLTQESISSDWLGECKLVEVAPSVYLVWPYDRFDIIPLIVGVLIGLFVMRTKNTKVKLTTNS